MVQSVDVLLIHPAYHRRAGSGIIPPIGLAYIAASLETHGFSVAILDCALDCSSQSPAGLVQFQQYLEEKLANITPRYCIGVGPTTTPALKSLHVLANALKQHYPQTPIVYGGPFASLPSQRAIFFDLLEATVLIRGDGDEAFPKLVRAFSENKLGMPIPGVSWHKEDEIAPALVPNIDRLPFPARHLLENHRYRPSLRRNIFDGPITPIYRSRGCPYRCNFCVSPLLRGDRVFHRSLENLFAEMQECIDRFGISGFIFYDDCLFVKSKTLTEQVREFCAALIENVDRVTWEMELRCDAVALLDSQSLHALAAAGCGQINMGIEKPSNRQLQYLNKQLKTDDITVACHKIKTIAPSIRLAGTFILGGPEETEADIAATIAFARSLPLDFAHFYPLAIYPGTPFFDRVTGEDRTPTAWAERMLKDEENYWGEMLYETEVLPGARLIELTHIAYREFYQREEWRDRFTAATSPEIRSSAGAVVERWCSDRFQLLSAKPL